MNTIDYMERELKNDLGMEVIETYSLISVNNIKLNTEYQRSLEPARLRRISKSIKRHGYWPQEVIILNEKYEAIDGNHRLNAAIENDIDQVPVSIVKFPNKKLEAKFFSLKNSFNTQLKPIDFWHARYISGHPYAILIYKLESDECSLFYNKIAIKGHATEESKFTIPKTMDIINTSAFNSNLSWHINYDAMLTEKAISTDYSDVRIQTNKYLDFFYKCFGQNIRENPLPYRTDTLRAFLIFYSKLKNEKHIMSPSKISDIVRKMKTFVFTVDFLKTDQFGKTVSFINFYNRKRKHKITYNIDID